MPIGSIGKRITKMYKLCVKHATIQRRKKYYVRISKKPNSYSSESFYGLSYYPRSTLGEVKVRHNNAI